MENFKSWAKWFLENRPDLLKNVAPVMDAGQNGTRMLMSILSTERLTAVLRRMLDPEEFLSDYGIRCAVALSPRIIRIEFEADGQNV